MKHADIAVLSQGRGRLGHGSVEPGQYGVRSDWPRSSRLSRTVGLVRHWLDLRRQRLTLSQLDDRMLKDVGITRFDVQHEVEKPFWQL